MDGIYYCFTKILHLRLNNQQFFCLLQISCKNLLHPQPEQCVGHIRKQKGNEKEESALTADLVCHVLCHASGLLAPKSWGTCDLRWEEGWTTVLSQTCNVFKNSKFVSLQFQWRKLGYNFQGENQMDKARKAATV